MKQQTPAMAQDQGFEHHRKPTRREQFLEMMNQIMPWEALRAVVEPYYPKPGNGRPPIGLERMLRIHFLQHWFNLAHLACKESLYGSASLRRFAGTPAGEFRGPMVVTMRPMKSADVIREVQITSRFPGAHGAPVHLGAPRLIGISELAKPDHGDAVDVRPGEIPESDLDHGR